MEIYRAIQNGCVDEAHRVAEPRPRRYWQIHLSTAIVLMLVAGWFIGANALQRESVADSEDLEYAPIVEFGRPATLYFYVKAKPEIAEFSIAAAAIDLSFLVVLLAIVAGLFETVISGPDSHAPPNK